MNYVICSMQSLLKPLLNADLASKVVVSDMLWFGNSHTLRTRGLEAM